MHVRGTIFSHLGRNRSEKLTVVFRCDASVNIGFSWADYNVGMYLRRCGKSSGRKGIYWELVESRIAPRRGPRQRVVAYLGSMSKPEREGSRLQFKITAGTTSTNSSKKTFGPSGG